MKKRKNVILSLAFFGAAVLTGCGTQAESQEAIEETTKEAAKATIICTAFPEYDWVCEILGEKKEEYEVQLLLDTGVDIHSYQPTAEDIAKISNCDLFVYTGGVSESWIEETLKGAANEEMQVVVLMDELGDRIKNEEIVEGVEHEHGAEEHSHAEDMQEGETHAGEVHESDVVEYDEHIWLSLKNAQILVEALGETLIAFDAENEVVFQKNAENYIEKLTELDGEYQKAVEEADFQTILFGDRFPFLYLTDDYDLEYYAAFTGCSAETEASFETIAFLAEKLDELELPVVLVIESSDQKLAQTIISSTQAKNQEIFVMNSLQAVSQADMENGVNYLQIMEENLEVLKEALNKK